VQDIIPIREERFTLILPAGWSYESNWLNHATLAPKNVGTNQWNWTLNDVAAVKIEPHMPPWQGIAGRMVVSLVPPGGKNSGIKSWNDIGAWYDQLISDRRNASPEIKQKVTELTAGATSPLGKIQALAKFVQTEIRYVAIELGLGGHQPHPAADIFKNRYGDCKDNATLLSSMLKEIGVDSYYVIINTERGAVSALTPPNLKFNHAILAIVLPPEIDSAALPAHLPSPKWGRLLFFDPTDGLTPFGSLRGELQANFALLVGQGGGELLQLPQLAPESSGVTRTAKMQLDDNGTLHGEVIEVHVGGSGSHQRALLRSAQRDIDRIKPIENLAGESLSNFQVLRASILNLHAEELPFQWHYTLQVDNYSKAAGDLILLRPRLIGKESDAFLETKEARVHPIEFDRPERDTDTVEILLPTGYSVDELPPATNIDAGFAAYNSKTAFSGHTLKYTRTLEIKQLSVPASQAEQLKAFYRDIAGDERNSAVLKKAAR
jgi:Transglutaminase-like superfamily